MTVTIIALENEASIDVAIDAVNADNKPTTVADVCEMPEVLEFFVIADEDDRADAVKSNLAELNGTEVPEGLRNIVLNSAVSDGDVLKFDLEGEEAVEEEEKATEEHKTGNVKIYVDGGLSSVDINITEGVTTLANAIYNDVVRHKLGDIDDARLSGYMAMVNGDAVAQPNWADRKLRIGDEIMLNASASYSKA